MKTAKTRNLIIKILLSVFICCLILSVTVFNTTTPIVNAATATYRTGANAASTSYKNGRYYKHYNQVPITGDGVTDVLAMALSQMGYQEGASSGSYSGESSGSSNYTEYCYNMGDFGYGYGGSNYPWCATFVSWSLYQSQVSNIMGISNWCRNHQGDINYIWCEVSCSQWANQLKKFSYFKERSSGYTPKSGDLIFFRGFAHIGIVVWQDGTNVYTIEGNTSDSSGVDANGGGAYYKKYSLSNTNIDGYGTLPYKTNSSVKKVDYSGANKTAGLYMTNASFNLSSTPGGGTTKTLSRFNMFKVTGFSGSYAIIVYDGVTYYGTLNSSTLQISASEEEASIKISSSTSYNAGGSAIPSGYTNDPNVVVTGLQGSVNNYWGLEEYNNNKMLILVNGRTLYRWEEKSTAAIERLWVRSKANGEIYLGFDLNDTNTLKLNGQSGSGEVLDTIVLKRGFEFANTTADKWGQNNVFATSSNISGTVGTLTKNIVLKAKSGGGFDIYVDAQTTQSVQSQYQYGKVVNVTSNLNVRSGAGTSYDAIGKAYANEEYMYYGTSNGWYNIDFNGTSGWVSGDYFTSIGYKYTTTTVQLSMPGYEIKNAKEVTITGNVYIVKTPAGAGEDLSNAYRVGYVGERFEYLNEMADRWYKINYDGQIGYISSNYSTLSAEAYVTINALNPEWAHTHNYNQSIVADKYKVSNATCVAKAVYKKSCSCGEAGTTTFTAGSVNTTNHTGTATKIVANNNNTHDVLFTCCNAISKDNAICSGGTATCQAKAVCSTCKVAYGNLSTTNHASTETKVVANNNNTHDVVHTCCNAVKNNDVACSGGTATCKVKAVCSTCKVSYGNLNTTNHVGTETKVVANNNNTHDVVYTCCNAVKNNDVACSGGTATCQAKAVCSTCKATYGSLSATNHTATSTKIVANNNGTHDIIYTCCNGAYNNDVACSGGIATCISKAVCSICNAQYGYLAEHIYGNVCDDSCNVCNYIREITGHIYDNGCDTICNACNTTRTTEGHVYDSACDTTCNECGKTRVVYGHTYDNACDSTCNKCNEVRTVIDHLYDTACDTTCNTCYFIREVPDHVYDNDCDKNCNECGAMREVSEHVYDSDCDNSCNNCNFIREVFGHVYDNDCDTTCNICNQIREVGEHVYSSNCDATCNKCHAVRPVSGHVYDNDCDSSCNECGDIREFFGHEYDNACDSSCNECGAMREVIGHVYSNNCDTTCNECNEIRIVEGHVYDSDCDITCNECNEIRSVSGHIYDNDCDNNCNECGAVRLVSGHSYDSECDDTCNNCNQVREATEHSYDNACDTICNECGEIREITNHVYDNGCDTICNECGEIREFFGHVYFDDCDTTCNKCGEIREVTNHVYDNDCDTTCNNCNAYRSVLDHVYDNSCDTTCNVCYFIRKITHDYNDNYICIVCNQEKPYRVVVDSLTFDVGDKLPSNAEIFVDNISPTSYDGLNALQAISNYQYNKNQQVAIFDIYALNNGVTVQPTGEITITLDKPIANVDKYVIYIIKQDSSVEVINTTASNNGKLNFSSSNFANVVFAEQLPTTADKLNTTPSNGENSSSLVVGVVVVGLTVSVAVVTLICLLKKKKVK